MNGCDITDGQESHARKPLPGWDGYFVGLDASVWSATDRQWRKLRTRAKRTGHLVVGLRRGGRRLNMGVHHAMLLAYGPAKPSPAHECRHLDGDPVNNTLTNLCWGTKKENADDRKLHGRNPVGVKHGQAKLNDQSVLEIRRMRQQGSTQDALATIFDVSRRAIRLVLSGANWSHV